MSSARSGSSPASMTSSSAPAGTTPRCAAGIATPCRVGAPASTTRPYSKARVGRDADRAARGQVELGAEQLREPGDRRAVTEQLADEDPQRRVPVRERLGREALEERGDAA